MTAKFNKNAIGDIIVLILRIWVGYVMMTNGRFFFKLFYSDEDRKFFEGWFGHGLHFPFPLFMAFLAKGGEFFGGLLVLLGLFTRVGAFLVAFTMLVATLAANIGKNWGVDGTITVSFCIMAVVTMYLRSGKYALDSLIRKN